MTCAFEPMSFEERRRFATRYAAYLSRRHGNLDPSNGQLQYRQCFLEEIRARQLRWPGSNVLEHSPIEQLLKEGAKKFRNPALWWTLSAVRWSHCVASSMPVTGSADDVFPYVTSERQSHVELMQEILGGLNVPKLPLMSVQRPWLTRGLFLRSLWMRESISHGVATAKVVVSSFFYDGALRVFSSHPSFAEHTRQVLQEMIIDESGYLHYLRSQLTDAQLSMARRVFLKTAHQWLSAMPELVMLVGKTRVKEALARARIFEIRQDMPRTSGIFRSVA